MKAQSKVKEQGQLHLHRQGEGPPRRLATTGPRSSNFGHKYVHIPTHYVRDYERLLTGGIWAQVDMRFEYDEESEGQEPVLDRQAHADPDRDVRPRRVPAAARASSRPTSGSTSWSAAWATSRRRWTRRLKLLFLVRLIPLCERNYNLVELGPRGTGKSYVVQESRRTPPC